MEKNSLNVSVYYCLRILGAYQPWAGVNPFSYAEITIDNGDLV